MDQRWVGQDSTNIGGDDFRPLLKTRDVCIKFLYQFRIYSWSLCDAVLSILGLEDYRYDWERIGHEVRNGDNPFNNNCSMGEGVVKQDFLLIWLKLFGKSLNAEADAPELPNLRLGSLVLLLFSPTCLLILDFERIVPTWSNNKQFPFNIGNAQQSLHQINLNKPIRSTRCETMKQQLKYIQAYSSTKYTRKRGVKHNKNMLAIKHSKKQNQNIWQISWKNKKINKNQQQQQQRQQQHLAHYSNWKWVSYQGNFKDTIHLNRSSKYYLHLACDPSQSIEAQPISTKTNG